MKKLPGRERDPTMKQQHSLADLLTLQSHLFKDCGLLQVIRSLVQRRREVKKLLGNERDPTKKQQLDIRQQALKLTANSMQAPPLLACF